MPHFDDQNQENKDSQCNFLSKFKNIILTYPNGKVQIDFNIGLKDICVSIMFRGFNIYSDVLPQIYMCKKFNSLDDFLDNLGEEESSKIWSDQKPLFDTTVLDTKIDGKLFPVRLAQNVWTTSI